MPKRGKNATQATTAPKNKGWDSDCGLYYCGGCVEPHTSIWLALIKTVWWNKWCEYARKNMLYDVDEVSECGWASVKHMTEFLDFVAKNEKNNRT